MSSPRLFFLYPRLFRTALLGDSASGTARRPRSSPRGTSTIRCQPASPFASATTPRRAHFVKRHGKAVEPTPLHGESEAAATPAATDPKTQGGEQAAKAEKAKPVKTEGKAKKAEPVKAEGKTEGKKTQGNPTDTAKQADNDSASAPPTPEAAQAEPDVKSAAQPASDSTAAAPADSPTTSQTSGGPMETVLHMGPPSDHQEGPGPGPPPRPPHLSPSPYVHHFDSYSLVKQLAGGGWTPVQAITAMKAIRGILAANLEVAQAGLVSKSDVENETYLFRAACSELGAELRNSRRIADGKMRQQRTTLQHEVDILTQSLNQEVLTLNDSVRGMFNDRKMAVREEQKSAESAVSGSSSGACLSPQR